MQKLVTLQRLTLPFGNVQVNAFALLPQHLERHASLAILAHGYTSHKGQILNWGTRLAEEGIPCLLFDWPGHFLGSFSGSGPWEHFRSHAHELFHAGHARLQSIVQGFTDGFELPADAPVIYGGHSLGALMALKALQQVSVHQPIALAVGLGKNSTTDGKHLFESDLYRSTLHLRAQLVDSELAPERFFAWIDQEKSNLLLSDAKVLLLSGKDDMVVGKDGPEWMAQHLERQGNVVTLERPDRLPHHEPELAAPYLKKYLRALGLL